MTNQPNEPKVSQTIDLDLFLAPKPVVSATPSVLTTLPMPDADRMTVLGIVLDDSGSMRGVGSLVNEGLQQCVAALRGAKGSDFYLHIQGFRQRYFSGLLKDYLFLKGYAPDYGFTPLYNLSISVLDEIREKANLYRGMGIPTTVAFIAITDGGDNNSSRRAEDFKEKIQSGDYLAAMGIVSEETSETMYKEIFSSMGITNIVTPGSSPSELRRAFNQVSQSVASISVK